MSMVKAVSSIRNLVDDYTIPTSLLFTHPTIRGVAASLETNHKDAIVALNESVKAVPAMGGGPQEACIALSFMSAHSKPPELLDEVQFDMDVSDANVCVGGVSPGPPCWVVWLQGGWILAMMVLDSLVPVLNYLCVLFLLGSGTRAPTVTFTA